MDHMNEAELDRVSGETGRALKAEEKVTLVIEQTQDGAPWEGGINGYFFIIKRGVPVEVPKTLAELICENARARELSKEALAKYRSGAGKNLSV